MVLICIAKKSQPSAQLMKLATAIVLCLLVIDVTSQKFDLRRSDLIDANNFGSQKNPIFERGNIGDLVIKKPTSESDDVHKYRGTINIALENGQDPSTIIFWINFAQNPKNCGSKKCFIGWIVNYITVDGETGEKNEIEGYPKVKGAQPVFKFAANGTDED